MTRLTQRFVQWNKSLSIGKKAEYAATSGLIAIYGTHYYQFADSVSQLLKNPSQIPSTATTELTYFNSLLIFTVISAWLIFRMFPTIGYLFGYAVDIFFGNVEEVEQGK